jgi:DNA invertase Pin-like site-specific DNA recombinase
LDDYARIHVDGVKIAAHRWVYEQVYGIALPQLHQRGPGEQVVMHTCDHPPCIRPSHLRLGSPLDNIRDAVAKGRMRGGNSHATHRRGQGYTGKGKVSAADAAEIRRLFESGHSYAVIADLFSVSGATVGHIVTGKTHTGRPNANRSFTDRQEAEIRRLVLFGAKQSDVARAYGVTATTICRIVHAPPRTM